MLASQGKSVLVGRFALCLAVLAQCATAQTVERPNILLIVADDLGYSDLGAYGGEISTPNLDEIARHGVLFTDFHAAATCSVSRSMLLTGVDHHRNGMGGLDEGGALYSRPRPGYEGYLNEHVVTVTELLRDAGYLTYMAGKWHLGRGDATGPHTRGFAHSFALLGGAASHYTMDAGTSAQPKAQYREDGQPVDKLPPDFYSSRSYTDKLIAYSDQARAAGRPFFMYAAYTAPHWPLQAPRPTIEKYAGIYDAGYDAIRDARVERMRQLGRLAPGLAHQPERSDPAARDWSSLDAQMRGRESRRMQVYAAMVDALDEQIGRLLAHLRETGQLERTAIFFLSDNGPEGNDPYVIQDNATWIPQRFDTRTESLGDPGSFAAYGPGWARVSATPFALYKAFPTEGGIRVPAIAWLPADMAPAGVDTQFATVLDITPTLLDIAGVRGPGARYQGRKLIPIEGRSLLSRLQDVSRRAGEDSSRAVGWELFGRTAVRRGRWKIVRVESPYGTAAWQLFDLAQDPFEGNDLAQGNPRQLRRMLRDWSAYLHRNGVWLQDYSNLQYGRVNRHYEH
ncbi:MAG: arylsulfatase [Steroidobacteraceae bacterium]